MSAGHRARNRAEGFDQLKRKRHANTTSDATNSAPPSHTNTRSRSFKLSAFNTVARGFSPAFAGLKACATAGHEIASVRLQPDLYVASGFSRT